MAIILIRSDYGKVDYSSSAADNLEVTTLAGPEQLIPAIDLPQQMDKTSCSSGSRGRAVAR
jgi:hypothetical protein